MALQWIWHISESVQDGLSVSIALSLVVRKDDLSGLREVAGGGKHDMQNPPVPCCHEPSKTIPFDPVNLQQCIQNIPAGFRASSRQGEPVAVAWMKFATAMGFINTPVPGLPGKFDPENYLMADSSWPVVYLEYGDKLLVGVDGHVFACPNQEDFKKIIENLNRGQIFNIQAMREDGQNKCSVREIIAFLEEICRVRPGRLLCGPKTALDAQLSGAAP